MCMGPEHVGQGWHSGATVGVYAAAAGAARALDLDADLLIIATDADAVYLDWGTPQQRAIREASPDEIAAKRGKTVEELTG